MASRGRGLGARSLTLDPSPASVRVARQFVTDTLRELGRSGAAEEASLCASELVTNAIRHCAHGCQVAVSEADGAIRIEVHDASAEPPRSVPASPRESGRGLLIVAALADRWGVDVQRGDGKSVWCELDPPSA